MDLRAQKRRLRRTMVDVILAMDPRVRRAEDEALLGRFLTLEGRREAGVVLLYVKAFPEEIDTDAFLTRSLQEGQRVACPRVDRASRRLRLFEVRDPATELEPGTLGIPEPGPNCPEIAPREIDWALVPGLAFDGRGFRLGRGAGHYDRLLPTLRPDVLRWSLCYDCQWVEDLPDEAHDIPLDGVASPRKAIRFDKASTPGGGSTRRTPR